VEHDPENAFTCTIDENLIGPLRESVHELGKELGDLSYQEAAAVVVNFALGRLEGLNVGRVQADGMTILDIQQDGQQAFEGFVRGQMANELLDRVCIADEIIIEIMRNTKVWERGKRLRKKVPVETYRFPNVFLRGKQGE